MNRAALPLLSIILLTACGSSSSTPGDQTGADAIPDVPRVVKPLISCPAGAGNSLLVSRLVAGLGSEQRDQWNVVSGALRPQMASANTVWDLLYDTKVLINTLYFGFSSVDLQELHAQTYTTFKKTFTAPLTSYAIQGAQVDGLMDAYLNAVGDGHTYYLNASDYQAYLNSGANAPLSKPVFGVSVSAVLNGNGTLIYDVRGDGPAFAAGLRRGDVILSVNGVPLTRTVPPVQNGAYLDDSAQNDLYAGLLSAAAGQGAAVPLVVRRGGVQRSVKLSGATLNSVRYPWGEPLPTVGGKTVYYLRLPTFSGPSSSNLKSIAQAVHELVAAAQSQNASGIIVDLRNNGGGLLREFVAAAGAFSPQRASQQLQYVDGTFTKFWYQGGQVQFQNTCLAPQPAQVISNPQQWTGKVAVLVNAYSASASEMFSQILRSAGQTTIIGEETYGVGNTSTFILPTPNSAVNSVSDGEQAVSITAGRVSVGGQNATPSVQPDLSVPDDEAALAATGVDTALQQAVNYLSR